MMDIIDAVKRGSIETIQGVISAGKSMDVKDEGGWFALLWAIQIKRTDILEILIKAGADVNIATNDTGQTPLMRASVGGYLEITKKLIQAGANVNGKDKLKRTPLMKASYRGNVEVIQELITQGARVKEEDHRGNTALCWALSSGTAKTNEETANQLIKLGADINDIFKSLDFFMSKNYFLIDFIGEHIHLLNEKNLKIWKSYRLRKLFK